MSTGTVKVDVTLTAAEQEFTYRETENTTQGAVEFLPAGAQFKAFQAGRYQLVFTATNFDLAAPPVEFLPPTAPWLQLNSGFTAKEFSLTSINTGTVKNQMGSFEILQSDGGVADPTVVNNPIPTPLASPHPQQRR